MQDLRANTQVIVTVGPFVDVTDGVTPETGVALSTADEAELLKHGSTTVVDISGATWAAVTGMDGYYSLTLTTSHTDTEGQLTIAVNDDSVCLPVIARFRVLSEAAYDSLYAAKDAGFMDVNVKTIGRADTQETEADNLEAACANYSATRGLTGTAVPAAAADAAGGLAISDAGGLDLDAILADTADIQPKLGTLSDKGSGATVAGNLDDMAGATFAAATDSLEAIRDRGDAAWTTGGGGSITDILNVHAVIPVSIDLADTATVRVGLMLTNALDDLPSTAEITPGTVSIDRKAIGGTSWSAVVTDAACSEQAGTVYYDEVFDSGSGYAEGDSIRVTFKSQKITVSANDYEITDANGVMFQTFIRQTMRGTDSAALASVATEARLAELDAANLPATADAIETDTQDIQSRIPAALVGGRMDSDLGAKTGNVALSAQEKLDVNAEADTALSDYAPATAAALTTHDGKLDTAQADLDLLTGADGATLASSQPNYTPATAAALSTHDGKLDTAQADLDIITGADGANLLSGTQASIDAIKAITDAIGATAAANLAKALGAAGVISGTVDTVTNTHTPTTTEFQADDITEATTDHYKGRIVIFTSGALLGQATDITGYSAVGGIGQFTVTALTEAPANNDTFIIV